MSLFRLLPNKSDVLQDYNKPTEKNAWKLRVFEIIFQSNTPAGKLFDIILFVLILSNIFILLVESIPSIGTRYYLLFRMFDLFYMLIFSIEYVLRILCVKSPKKYVFSFYGMIDLLSILPSYLEFILPQSHMLMLIRSFRLLRIFRIFNMVKFLDESRVLLFSIIRSFRKITIFLFFVVLLTIFLGSVMYVIEYKHNSGFTSIPQSIYWSIVTITTVGYGDIAPITPLGKIFASFIMILGYAIIAVPTGILSSDLARRYAKRKVTVRCNNCLNEDNPEDARYCNACGNLLKSNPAEKEKTT